MAHPTRHTLVHEIKALVREQGPKALAEVVIGVFRESHLLDCRQVIVARPDFLTGGPQVLQEGHLKMAMPCREGSG